MMSYMRMVGRVADAASRERLGAGAMRKERTYMFTQSLWGAMAYLCRELVVEGEPVRLDAVVGLPAKVIKDVRYGAERCGLSYEVRPYRRGGPTGPLVGHIVQVQNDREVLGYYAHKAGHTHTH